MLVLKHKHHLDFPHVRLGLPKTMTLSPVLIDDDDELSQAIANDAANNENDWALSERPDQSDLEQFWANVEADVLADPEWADFASNS